MYLGEDYTLQIDSHSRFAQDWDELLVTEFEKLGDDMALFSGYPPSFELNDNGVVTVHAGTMNAGILAVKVLEPNCHIQYHKIDNHTGRPVKSRLIAAGFVFARGHLITSVPYDPDHYYLGEEISYAVRAFTHGYNLYTPTQIPVYHLYFGHIKQTPEAQGKRIRVHNNPSQERAFGRLRSLVVDKDDRILGKYGPGKVRTVEQYELYAGINFARRRVHPDARAAVEPNPVTCNSFDWKVPFKMFDVNYSNLLKRVEKPNLMGCHVTVCDGDGIEIFHRYFSKADAPQFYTSPKLRIYIDVETVSKITILPHSNGGFDQRVEEPFATTLVAVEEPGDGDYNIKNDHHSYSKLI